MEVSNGDIIKCVDLINAVASASLPAVSAIRISRLLSRLQEERQEIIQTRMKKMQEHQATNADGEKLFIPDTFRAKQKKAQEEDADLDMNALQEVEVDLPDKVPESHEFASDQPFIPERNQRDLNEDLNKLYKDTVELNAKPLPKDEISEFEEPFYNALEESEEHSVSRGENESGFRPADIAPIAFIFPEDV
jgi:hypothetical protein